MQPKGFELQKPPKKNVTEIGFHSTIPIIYVKKEEESSLSGHQG